MRKKKAFKNDSEVKLIGIWWEWKYFVLLWLSFVITCKAQIYRVGATSVFC